MRLKTVLSAAIGAGGLVLGLIGGSRASAYCLSVHGMDRGRPSFEVCEQGSSPSRSHKLKMYGSDLAQYDAKQIWL